MWVSVPAEHWRITEPFNCATPQTKKYGALSRGLRRLWAGEMTRTDTAEGRKTEWGEEVWSKASKAPWLAAIHGQRVEATAKCLEGRTRTLGSCDLVIMVQHPSSPSPLPPPPQHLCLCYCQRKWGRQGVKTVGGMGKWRTRSGKKGGLRSSVVASPIVFSRLRLTATVKILLTYMQNKKTTTTLLIFINIFEGLQDFGMSNSSS